MVIPFVLTAAALLLLQASPPQERTRVEYVLVDVVARDRTNHLVTDLTLDDFVVTDGGKKVALESLDILDLRREVLDATAPPVVSDAPFLPAAGGPRRSQVLMVLDVVAAGRGPTLVALRNLEGYLGRTEPLRGLEYRLYSVNAGSLMETFSEEPDALLRALGEFRMDHLDAAPPPGTEAGTPDDLFGLEKRFQDCQAAVDRLAVWNCTQEELHAFVERETAHADAVLRDLADLPSKFSRADGARTLVLLSAGFSVRPGRAAMELARHYLPSAPPPPSDPIATPGFGSSPPAAIAGAAMPWPELLDFGDAYLRLLDACARERVTIYAVDLLQFGLEERRAADAQLGGDPRSSVIFRDQRLELQSGPEGAARQTGGTFSLALDRVRPSLEGDRFIYVLGYRSPAGKAGKYRKLGVRCRRNGVRLAHREGYVS